MAGLTDNVGLLFKIRADSEQAQQTLTEFRKDFKKTESDIKGLGTISNQIFQGFTREMGLSGNEAARLKSEISQFASVASTALSGVGTVVGVFAGALAAAGVAAIGLGVGLFKITQAASEYGSVIFDAREKTGLTAETLSTLKLNADSAGSSFEQVVSGTTKLAKLMGEASDGSAKAAAKLQELGVTSNDLDTALAQVVKTIAAANSGTDQIVLAQKAFGKSGADLIPVIKQMGGDLKDATEKARDLGGVLTEQDIRAADDFGDTLTQLGTQAKTLSSQFALQFAPEITSAMKAVSRSMSENKEVARGAGEELSRLFRGISTTASAVASSFVATVAKMAFEAMLRLDPLQYAILKTINALKQLGGDGTLTGKAGGIIEPSAFSSLTARAGGSLPGGFGGGGGARGGGGRDTAAADAERAQREQERIDERNLTARIQRIRSQLNELQSGLRDAVGEAVKNLSNTSDEALMKINLGFDDWINKIASTQNELTVLQNLQRANMTVEERNLLTQRQNLEREKDQLDVATSLALVQEGAANFDEKANKDAQKALDKEIKQLDDKLQKLKDIEDETRRIFDLTIPKPDGHPDGGKDGPFTALNEDLERLHKNMLSVVGLKTVVAQFGQIAASAFEGMASAVGGAIEQWALYGGSITKALRQALAAEFAHIAAVATVNALYATALGFLRLAMWDFAGAGNAFASAGLWAALAGGTAIAARAISPQNTAQQASNGGVVGGSQQSQSTRNTDNNGQYYSSNKDATTTNSINRALTLNIKLDSNGVLKVVKDNIVNNGMLRPVIINAGN